MSAYGSFLSLLLQDMLLAAIPAAGFAMIFNVPRKALSICAALAAVGHGSRYLMHMAGLDMIGATFIASALVGALGIQCSRWWVSMPPKIFTVAAIIPMFPGLYAFKAMLAAIKISQSGYETAAFETLVSYFLRTASMAGALSIGLSLAGLWLYRKAPRV